MAKKRIIKLRKPDAKGRKFIQIGNRQGSQAVFASFLPTMPRFPHVNIHITLPSFPVFSLTYNPNWLNENVQAINNPSAREFASGFVAPLQPLQWIPGAATPQEIFDHFFNWNSNP